MNPLTDALGATLLHAVWQCAIVGLGSWLALAMLSRRSANARYAVSCAALALMVVIPIVTFWVLYTRALPLDRPSTVPATVGIAVSQPSVENGAAEVSSTVPLRRDWRTVLQEWAPPLWFIGVLLYSVRLGSAGAYAIAVKRHGGPGDAEIASRVSALARQIGVTRPVAVLISTTIGGPATVGWIRPVILLPPASVLGVTPQQLEALLAHELAHIRRHDYAVNVLQMVAETILFYHPAIWWVSSRIRMERELCCDDIAMACCGDAVEYAQALTRVAGLQVGIPGVAVGSSGGFLVRRIQRVLGVAPATRNASPATLLTVALVVAAVAFTAVGAQAPLSGTQTAVSARGTIQGQVVDAVTGLPVSGARVRAQYVTGVENPTRCPIDDCNVIVDKVVGPVPMYRQTVGENGRFEIRGVRPGDYFVQAAASGYIQRFFGQTSDHTPEVTVRAAPGPPASPIDIRLERAGAITGRIFGDSGDGLPGVEVVLLSRRYMPGGARVMPVAFEQTEDLGVFHFRDVVPGEYYVRAYTEAIRPVRADRSMAYADTFSPGVRDLEAAQPVVVMNALEVGGVDFALAVSKVRTVSGRLVDPAGRSLATATVRLGNFRGTGSVADMPGSPVSADGRFRIDRVSPGEYMVMVLDAAEDRRWSAPAREIVVADADVTDLVLVASLASPISGRIVGETGRALPFDVSELDIVLMRRFPSGAGWSQARDDVGPDGAFQLRGGSGEVHLQIDGLQAPWSVNSAILNGVDVTDQTFELREGIGHRLDITLTDRVVRLSGTVTDRSARSVPNALVVAFPDDRNRWQAENVIRTTFSHQQGQYELRDVPRGDYRVVAVTALPRLAWTDPAVLDRLWPSSAAVRFQDDNNEVTVPLRVTTPPTDLFR